MRHPHRRGVVASVVTLALIGLTSGCGGTTHNGTSRSASGSATAGGSTRSASPSGPPRRPAHLHIGLLAARLPERLSRESVQPLASAPGHWLVAGGMLEGDVSTAHAYEIALPSGKITRQPDLGVPVHDTAGGPLGGSPAVVGGGNSSEQSVVQVLRGATWTQATHLPSTRSDLSVAEAGGRTYVLGGYDGSGTPTQVLAAQSGSGDAILRRAGTLHAGVRYAGTASTGSSVYLAGGEVNDTELATVQRFDPTTGHTSVVGRLPQPVGHSSAAWLGGRLLIMGGRTAPDTQTARMWWFDPAKGTFSRAGRLPMPLSDAGVAVAGNSVYLLGGETTGNRLVDRVLRITLR